MESTNKWRWERWVFGALGAFGTVLIAATQVSATQAASNLASWAKFFGLGAVTPFLHSAHADAWGLAVGSGFIAFSGLAFFVHGVQKGRLQGREPAAQLGNHPPANFVAESSPVTAKEKEPERIYVGKKVTAKYLASFFEPPNTTMQARLAVAPFLGKWMTIRGIVKNIEDNRAAMMTGEIVRCIVVSLGPTTKQSVAGFYCNFDQEKWNDRIIILRPGELITVTGTIEAAGSYGVELSNCELLSNAKNRTN